MDRNTLREEISLPKGRLTILISENSEKKWERRRLHIRKHITPIRPTSHGLPRRMHCLDSFADRANTFLKAPAIASFMPPRVENKLELQERTSVIFTAGYVKAAPAWFRSSIFIKERYATACDSMIDRYFLKKFKTAPCFRIERNGINKKKCT